MGIVRLLNDFSVQCGCAKGIHSKSLCCNNGLMVLFVIELNYVANN